DGGFAAGFSGRTRCWATRDGRAAGGDRSSRLALLLGARKLRQNPGDQPRRRFELPQLPLQSVQHAGLEIELAGAPGADLQVLLDNFRFLRGEPAIEEVIEQAERLLAVGSAQPGHASASLGLSPTIPSSSATCQSAFCSIFRPRCRRERTVPTGHSRIRAISS